PESRTKPRTASPPQTQSLTLKLSTHQPTSKSHSAGNSFRLIPELESTGLFINLSIFYHPDNIASRGEDQAPLPTVSGSG
ncbi:MAG: hypothetical protein Q8O52_07670, partial [Sulfuritalea sp.]|nr:hypothetical protein [Sulfuritalea sp.]